MRIHKGWIKNSEGKWFKHCKLCGELKEVENDFYFMPGSYNKEKRKPSPRCKKCDMKRNKEYKQMRRLNECNSKEQYRRNTQSKNT